MSIFYFLKTMQITVFAVQGLKTSAEGPHNTTFIDIPFTHLSLTSEN